MLLTGIPINDVDHDTLKTLVGNSVSESKTLEFKRDLPGGTSSQKKEFLRDATAFANSVGGVMVFGIDEDNGVADAIKSIPKSDADEAILRMENLLRTGVNPRVVGHTIRSIDVNGGCVVVLGLPRSSMAPHMVVLQGDDRFYIRNSGGKHRMDVGEVRTAFNLSQEAGERIRRFQAERVGRIRADAAPLPLMSEPKVVLHIIPLNYSNVSQSYDVGQARRSNQKLKPMFESIRDYRFNADGVVEYSWRKDKNISTSYTQLFRSGAIEAVAVAGAHNEISPESVENEVGRALLNYLPVLESLGVDLPLVTLVSILDGKGASFFGNNIPTRTSFNSQSYGLDRDVIHLPDVLLQSYDPDIAESLQPIFDALWQSGGYSGSPRYR